MSKLSPTDLVAVKSELERLALTMDIPFERRKDAGWILRNVGINNKTHHNLERIVKIAKIIVAEESGNV